MRMWKHVCIVAGSLFVTLGAPYMTTDHFRNMVSGNDIDAVSSASVIVEQPSGNYLVLMNLDKHGNADAMEQWRLFFSGSDDYDVIFEDVVCTVASSDPNGRTMAESFRSRLPENQMKVKSEDATLMLSKAEYGKFDVIVMSEEVADLYTASQLYDKGSVEVMYVKGEQ